jgi:hypothetical protein
MKMYLQFSIILSYSILVIANVCHLSALVHMAAHLVLAVSHLGMVVIDLAERKDP